ncbi:Ribonuclease H [Fusarium albosuccineum]|uniref:Ribonuclease H n=1 Tax=Fusarium albosuccineum TaxID=1237068 RepID=A0A8H4LFL2_9HYPO|nr:Ribonuclease H [Fusarium albosuccineum]
MLSHLDPKKRLFLQLDGSLERGFGAVLFLAKESYVWKEGTHILANVMRPIAFVSKTLTRAETHYGPTELEVACLLWAVRRLKAHVGSSEGSLTMFTDHPATKPIVEKTRLETTSTDRANRKLVNASIYLSEFDLLVFRIAGKNNFVLDSLSRLKAPETDTNLERRRPDYAALIDVLVGIEAMMGDDTREHFQKGYLDDAKYHPMMKMVLNQDGKDTAVTLDRLRSEDAVSVSKRGIPFLLKKGLLYHEGVDRYLRPRIN